MSSSADKLKREAVEAREKKLPNQKVTLLNTRGPKEDPPGKELPQPDQMMGPPLRKE